MNVGQADNRCLGCQFRDDQVHLKINFLQATGRSSRWLDSTEQDPQTHGIDPTRNKATERNKWRNTVEGFGCARLQYYRERRRRSYMSTKRRETAWLTGAFLQLFIVAKDGYGH
jgi:hypothetical protein